MAEPWYPFPIPEAEAEGSGPVTRRWLEQRWMVDAMVQLNGIRRFQPRLDAILESVGVDARSDVDWVSKNATQHAAISPTLAAAAQRREERGDKAFAAGRLASARSSYFIAANFYAAAQWALTERSRLNLDLNDRKRITYGRFAELADHDVEPVWIPFGGQALPGWLHLPPGHGGGPAPLVVSIPGMDGFKERFVPLHGDRWLDRGIAVLLFEGPGQFESAVLGIRLRVDAWKRVGKALIDWAETRPEIDTTAVGLVGSSLGSLLGTITVAHEPRFKACAVSATAFEPGMRPGFDSVHPFYKVRLMYLAGIYDESEFDTIRDELTWEGHVSKITRPYLAVGGGLDPMSPVAHARGLFEEMSAPRQLVIYEGSGHGVAGSAAAAKGPNYRDLMADWMEARLQDEPFDSTEWVVESSGRVRITPLD
ncbi:MAG: alpha/beta hydrolase family protein [Acidimicrobiia bacterium]